MDNENTKIKEDSLIEGQKKIKKVEKTSLPEIQPAPVEKTQEQINLERRKKLDC